MKQKTKQLQSLLLLLILTVVGTASAWGAVATISPTNASGANASYFLAADGTAITAIAGTGAHEAAYNSGTPKITVQGIPGKNVATIAFTIANGVTVTSFKVNGTANKDVNYALDGTAVTIGTELTELSKTGNMSFTLTCKDAASSSSNRNTEISSIVINYTTGGTVSVTGVSLNETSNTISVGENFVLTPTISPDNATNKNVTWSTSNSGIATVSDGTVTGVAAGNATITVTTVDGNHTATCNVTVKAKHRVTYDLGGGTGTLPTQADVMETGTFSVASGSGFSKDGYTFAGWSDGSNTYTAGATYTMGEEDVTLTAQWIEYVETYTVTFNGNGHGTPGETSLEGASVTLPDCEPATGFYQFMGWSTSSTATTATLSAGASYAPTKDITLYAVYNYRVSFGTNGAGGTVTAKYNDGTDFENNTYVPLNTVLYFNASPNSGYVFTGWGTATSSTANPLTYTIRDIKTFTATFKAQQGSDDEVWFAYTGDAINNGTVQSEAFTGVKTASESSTKVSGSYTIGGNEFTVTRRGANGTINISFTVDPGKVATLYGLATSSGTAARQLTLTGSGTAAGYSNTTQSTAASSSTAAGFSYSSLLPGSYTLKSTGNGAVVFLYLDLEDATRPTITTQPVGAEYNYGETPVAMTVAATAAAGGELSYQWQKSDTESGEYTNVGTGSSYSPSTTDAVGTKYYKVVVSEDGGGSTTSNVVAVKVNTNASDFTLSNNVVSAKVGAGNKTVTYTTSSTGTVTVSTSDSDVATVSVNESTKTITITPKEAGTATFTVSQAAVTGYAAGSATINVTVAAADAQTEETLFYRNFKDSEWNEAELEHSKEVPNRVNFDVTTRANDNDNDFSWSANGLKTPNKDFGSTYFVAIPLKRINGKINVNIKIAKSSENFKYCLDQHDEVGTPSSTANSIELSKATSVSFEVSKTGKVSTSTTTIDSSKDYVLYIGGKQFTLEDITITTPTPEDVTAAPTGVSLSPTSSDDVSTGETVAITCANTNGYNYKWYVGTTTSKASATEVYGETLSKFDFKPTEKGTYYIFCDAINSYGATESSNYATINVVETPTLSFNMASTKYNNNTDDWDESLAPVLTVTPANLLSSVTYTTSNANLTYVDAGTYAGGAANGIGKLTAHEYSGTYTVTATLNTSGITGVKDDIYTATLTVKVIAGYDDALVKDEGPFTVSATRDIKDDNGDVIATMTWGGWIHGNAAREASSWEKRADDPSKDSHDSNPDKWPKVNTGDVGAKSIDDYDYRSQSNHDSRSETRNFIEWETEGVKAKPYSLPCRGSYITVTPAKNGTLTVYLYQNGSMQNDSETKVTEMGPRLYYWFDQAGNVIPVETQYCSGTIKSKQTLSNMANNIASTWRDYGVTSADALTTSPSTDLERAIHDNWPTDAATPERPIKYKNGYFLPEKNFVKYSVRLLAGNTYYFFSNGSKMGYSGLNYAPAADDATLAIKHLTDATGSYTTENVSTVESLALTSNNTTYTAPSTTTTYKEVTLDRTFKQDTWNTICLPFSVSKEQVEKVFGKGTVFMGYDGFSNGTLSFIYHAYDYLLAGQPYFIKPTGKDADNNDLPTVEGGYIGAADSKNHITFNNVTIMKNQAVRDIDGKKDIFEFKGSFRNQSMTPYSYYLSGSGTLSYSKTKTYGLAGYRAFLYNETQSANSLVLNFEYKDFSDTEDVPTAIDDIMEYIAEQGITVQTRHGVYTLSGQKISDTPENLAPGLYIINGKKIYIK